MKDDRDTAVGLFTLLNYIVADLSARLNADETAVGSTGSPGSRM